MIEMGMAQNDGVDFRRIEWKGIAVAFLVTPAALDQAAVEQDFVPAHVENMTGAGDFGRRAKEFEFHGISLTMAGELSIA